MQISKFSSLEPQNFSAIKIENSNEILSPESAQKQHEEQFANSCSSGKIANELEESSSVEASLSKLVLSEPLETSTRDVLQGNPSSFPSFKSFE